MPSKKSTNKKKVVIAEEDAVVESMYERHPDLFEKKPLLGTMTYNISYVRSEPQQKSKVIKILFRDTPLEILSEDENGWTEVKTLDESPIQGYTKTAYIQKAE